MSTDPPRHIRTAELLSIGSELTVGDTRDTNAGELARSLTGLGVRVGRLTALPDDLAAVTEAFTAGLGRADLVVSTGGLGPTPDDLTREAIAAACGEVPAVDPDLEAWLRELWSRRGMPFPELNLKQAWRIPSADAIPNPNGTAPGWFVSRPDGRIIVALPGPPREMRPMWADEVLPRLTRSGLGAEVVARTYRLAGIGESQVAERLGEPMLRATNPIVATYARAEAVDIRISATADAATTAASLVEAAAAIVLERVGEHVWATGTTTWSEALGTRLGELGWTLAAVEIGTGGSLMALLGDAPWVRFDESIAADAPAATAHGDPSPEADSDPAADDVPDGLRRASPGVPASSVARTSGWPSGPGREPATPRWPSRSSRRRSSGGQSRRVPDGPDGTVARRAGRGGRAARDAPRRVWLGGRRLRDGPGQAPSAQRFEAVISPSMSRTWIPSPVDPDEAVVGELSEQLVHALPRAADHRRQLGLGQRPTQPDRAIRAPARAGLAGEPDEACGEPAGHVQEVQLLHVGRQPAELPGEGGQQRLADGGLGGDQLAEPVARQDDGLGGGRAPTRSRNAVRRRAGPARRTRRPAGGWPGSPRRPHRTGARS